jgi:tetratricopeptide (TPR) repeat protein
MKKILFLLLIINCSWLIAQQPYWFTLEQGKALFRNQDYGNALLAFEDARQQRQDMYTKMEQDLIALLSLPEVRRMNNSLSEVETYVQERNIVNASKVLNEIFYRVPKESLNNSAEAALTALRNLKHYPEAEYWIGEVFRAEGELGVALSQYKRAYNLRDFLDTPDFAIEILYRTAELHRIRQEYTLMEAIYLEILKNDTLWSGTDNDFVKTSMNRVLENDGIDQFLKLYRYNNQQVEKAHRELGLYYYSSGRHVKSADHLLFSFLIQNSIIIANLLEDQFDYSFSTVNDLFDQIFIDAALQEYVANVEYYKVIYYLGSAFYGSGNLTVARYFWQILEEKPEAGEWSNRAEAQLKSPFIEKINEMP